MYHSVNVENLVELILFYHLNVGLWDGTLLARLASSGGKSFYSSTWPSDDFYANILLLISYHLKDLAS